MIMAAAGRGQSASSVSTGSPVSVAQAPLSGSRDSVNPDRVSVINTGEPGLQREGGKPEDVPAGLPPAGGAPCVTAPIVQLPAEMLHEIFSYLALSTHSHCALVCRHWYRSLPAIRWQMTRWVRQQAGPLPWNLTHLAMGYSGRTRPWLIRHRCQQLPVLERQYQELLHHKGQRLYHDHRAAPPQRQALEREQTMNDMVSSLVRYSLQRQLLQAQRLTLQAADLHPDRARTPVFFAFSSCCRWLATCNRVHATAPVRLSLYGWQEGRWQEQTLVDPPRRAVTAFTYSQAAPDSLLSAHGSKVVVWNRTEGTANWLRVDQYAMRPGDQITLLASFRNGDLACLCRGQRQDAASLLFFSGRRRFFRNQVARHSWRTASPRESVTYMPRQCLLAFPMETAAMGRIAGKNEVHVWHAGRSRAAGWSCQVSALRSCHPPVRQIRFSPSAAHMLGLLADRQLCLWSLGADWRLTELMTVASCLNPATDKLSALAQFRRNDTQLALPDSSTRIRFWNRDESGAWQEGDAWNCAQESADRAEERLRQIQLSDDGRVQVRVTDRRVIASWLDLAGHRQQWVQCKPDAEDEDEDEAADCQPQACLPGQGALLCSTTADVQGTVRFHGLDGHGHWVSKGEIRTGRPIRTLFASPDGLSIMVGQRNRPPCFFQLAAEDSLTGAGQAL